jgi:hypothetical protein
VRTGADGLWEAYQRHFSAAKGLRMDRLELVSSEEFQLVIRRKDTLETVCFMGFCELFECLKRASFLFHR